VFGFKNFLIFFMEEIMRVIVGSLLLFASVGHARPIEKILRPWQNYSDPVIMSSTFQKKMTSLPLVGSAKDPRKLWSSDYWALRSGNINYRWNAPRPSGYGYHSPTKAEAMAMTEEQLKILSPSEKWDLYLGAYDYPLRKEVARYHSGSSYPSWQGICHGWAPAAMNHDEPHPVTVTNPDGIRVPFGSSDVKALLSYYYAYKYSPTSTHQMGHRCDESLFGDNCNNDMNAGAFHIVLTNKVGLEGGSFIADIERKAEVWNHPITAYRTSIIQDNMRPSNSARGTVKRMKVKTDMSYVYEIKKNSWTPVLGTDQQVVLTKHYQYTLDIDGSGSIVGGDWVSYDRPDFLWTVSPVEKFEGMFERLPDLL
jgi:hypothetical protein